MNEVNIDFGGCYVEMPEGCMPSGTELELWETESDRQRVLTLLKDFGLGADVTLVALGLTASAPLKQWPIAYYGELMNKLKAKRHDLYFVLLGDAAEQGEEMDNVGDVLNLCGLLTLRETGALLRHAVLYIGNDTGLMHIASAVGCAVVEVSSFAREGDRGCGISTSRFSPWSKEAFIVQPIRQIDACTGMCQMPYAHCITQVTVEAVLEASCKLLMDRG